MSLWAFASLKHLNILEIYLISKPLPYERQCSNPGPAIDLDQSIELFESSMFTISRTLWLPTPFPAGSTLCGKSRIE